MEKPGSNSVKVWQQQFVSHSSFGPIAIIEVNINYELLVLCSKFSSLALSLTEMIGSVRVNMLFEKICGYLWNQWHMLLRRIKAHRFHACLPVGGYFHWLKNSLMIIGDLRAFLWLSVKSVRWSFTSRHCSQITRMFTDVGHEVVKGDTKFTTFIF